MPQTTIAVLPFQHLGNLAYQYLAEGLTVTAQNYLKELPDYLVIAQESVAQLQTEHWSQQLEIDLLLEGMLSIEGESVHLQLSAQEANSSTILWNQAIQTSLREILSLGNQLVLLLQQQLGITPHNSPALNNNLPQNRQAYRAYLLGVHYLNKWNRAYTELALIQFEKVAELEPDYIPAYLGMAKASIFLVGRGFKLAAELYPPILKMLNQMLLINPAYGELYIYKGILEFFYLLDWDSAYKNIEKGLKNFSEASEAYSQLSHFWYGMRQYDKAIEALHVAMEYNPLSIGLLNMKGDILISAKRYPEAIQTFQDILDLQADDLVALENLLYIYSLQGNERLARKYWRLMQKQGELSVVSFPRIGFMQAKFGAPAAWQAIIDQLETLIEEENNTTYINRLASVYAGLGQWEQAMNYIEKGFNLRTGLLYFLADPMLEPLHSWPRYKKLEAQIILPKHLLESNSITIQSDLKKQLHIRPDNLLYVVADQNYSTLVLYNNFRLEQKLLRISIKRLHEQLPPEQFFHCHRSYLVNRQLKFEITGNARGYKLYSKEYDFEVPVARANIKAMKAIFQLA